MQAGKKEALIREISTWRKLQFVFSASLLVFLQILKPQRPFTDVQNLSRGIGGDDRYNRFCLGVRVCRLE